MRFSPALVAAICTEQIALTCLGIAHVGLEQLHDRRAHPLRRRNQYGGIRIAS